MSILDKKVSCFKNCKTDDSPRLVNLLVWFKSKKYINDLSMLRKISNKKCRDDCKREWLPAVTISGQFATKEADSLIEFNGLMALDIDNIENIEIVKRKLQSLPYIAYCGLSCSGRGLWCIVPVTPDSSNYEAHYRAIFDEMEGYNIKLDSLPDVNRLRIYSYDTDAYFNHNAETYTRTKFIQHVESVRIENDKYNQVLAQIEILERLGVDITAGDGKWIKIGAAFQKEFGENGRALFHRVSKMHPDYNAKACDKKYNYCAKMNRVGIATFFHLTKNYVL